MFLSLIMLVFIAAWDPNEKRAVPGEEYCEDI